MRRFVIAVVAGLAVIMSAMALPTRGGAVTMTASAGLAAAIDQTSAIEQVRWHRRHGWGWHWPHFWWPWHHRHWRHHYWWGFPFFGPSWHWYPHHRYHHHRVHKRPQRTQEDLQQKEQEQPQPQPQQK